MHKIFSRSSGNVIGIQVTGKLYHAEYKEIVPYLEERIRHYGQIRLLIELKDFEGWGFHAALDDLLFVFRHRGHIEKLALVIDTESDKWAVLVDQPFGRIMGSKEKIFKCSEIKAAWKWLEKAKTTLVAVDPTLVRGPTRYGPKMKILIVGGGLTGLTLAALLEKRGFVATLIEKNKSFEDKSSAVTLWPAGSRVLKGLGNYNEVLAESVPFKRFEIRDAHNKLIRSCTTQSLVARYGPVVNIDRPRLLQYLLDEVKPKNIHFGAALKKLEQSNEGVQVTLSNGDQAEYDLLVGCDGVRSNLRKLVFGKVKTIGPEFLRWNFFIAGSSATPGVVSEFWQDERVLGFYPVHNGVCVFAALPASLTKQRVGKDVVAGLQSIYRDFKGPVPEVLARLIESKGSWKRRFRQVKMDEWHRGRVILLGDASHAVLPEAGVGATLAMESALVLADELCCADSRYIARSLEQCVARRQRRIEHIQRLSSLYDRLYTREPKFFDRIRNIASNFAGGDLFLNFWDQMMSDPI